MNSASAPKGEKQGTRPFHGAGSLVLLAEIGDDVFGRGDRLLDISNLSKLVVADGAHAVLQRDDHLTPFLSAAAPVSPEGVGKPR